MWKKPGFGEVLLNQNLKTPKAIKANTDYFKIVYIFMENT